MRFWDSSALVPLVAREASTTWARQLVKKDSAIIVWTLSHVEVQSAVSRKHRDSSLSVSDYKDAKGRARKIFAESTHVVAVDLVRDRALRLLDLHNLRSADTLQLAAALVVSRERPEILPFVTLDERMALAAEREGFPVQSVV